MTSLQSRFSTQTFDSKMLRENHAELAITLSDEPNRAAFRRLVDIYYVDGKIAANERDIILSGPTPYGQVTEFLDDLSRKDSGSIEALPAHLGDAMREEVAAQGQIVG